jgi:hypothetical protein
VFSAFTDEKPVKAGVWLSTTGHSRSWAEGDGTWEVYGADDEGVYEGVLNPWTGTLELTYMAQGPKGGTLYFNLKKK